MPLWTRVGRNLARRKTRTLAVALIVGVSLGLFLVLSEISNGIEANTAAAKAAVQDIVTVQSASSSSGGGGFSRPTPITTNILPQIERTPDVVSVQRIVISTNGTGGANGSFSGGPGNFENITMYEGIDITSNGTLELFGGFGGGAALTMVSGSALTPSDENQLVAIVGQSYATQHDLQVNSHIDINGSLFGVIGIYSSGGGGFGGRTIIMPYPAASNALGVSGPDLIYVTVNSAGNVDNVVTNLTTTLGSGYSVSALGSFNGGAFQSSLDSILSSTQIEQYVVLAAGAGVMALVMILVTSQRTREVGLLKAFGFKNGQILSQLLAESVAWSLLGLPIGLLVSFWIGPSVANAIAGSSAPQGFGGRGFRGGGGIFGHLLGSVSFSVTPEVVLTGVLVTIGFGVVGACYPILRALRLRPSEALRHE